MTELSPSALAVWEAFNQDEAGVLVDYGQKLAAALRAAALELHAEEIETCGGCSYALVIEVDDLLAIADELEGC
jgi:hypothetical protein